MYFDTHAHYDSGAFNADWKELLASMPQKGVELIVNPGCDLESSRTAVALAEEFPHVYAAVGVHPSDCGEWGEGTLLELRQLASRLCLQAEFPHEIGVFLGYPLDDVKGFIRHKGRNYTYCGCWKCYGDPQAARRRFEGFRRCTETFRRRYAAGTPIIQLVVAA